MGKRIKSNGTVIRLSIDRIISKFGYAVEITPLKCRWDISSLVGIRADLVLNDLYITALEDLTRVREFTLLSYNRTSNDRVVSKLSKILSNESNSK